MASKSPESKDCPSGEYTIMGMYGVPGGVSEHMLRLKSVDDVPDELAVLVRVYDGSTYRRISTSRTQGTFNMCDKESGLCAVSWTTADGHNSMLMVSPHLVLLDGKPAFPLPVPAVKANGHDLVLDVDAAGYAAPFLGSAVVLKDGRAGVVCKLFDPTVEKEPKIHVLVDKVEEVVSLANVVL